MRVRVYVCVGGGGLLWPPNYGFGGRLGVLNGDVIVVMSSPLTLCVAHLNFFVLPLVTHAPELSR